MKPYRIRAVVLRHTYEVWHNANHITYMVYWPVVNILVWGFFTLYLRHGFEVIGEIRVGAGPLVTPMLRRPRLGGRG